MKSFIQANWPAPPNVHAYTTVRTGGFSVAPYDEFNVGEHVGDNPEHVSANRALLKTLLHLPNEPIWIRQTHSIITVEAIPQNTFVEADASYTNQANQVCLVQTADCLPLLICHRLGTHVAAVHAGWRGLANGVIESCLDQLNLPPDDILVWLGPAISSRHFEVGEEVRTAFLEQMPTAHHAFTPSPNKRWLADLYELARLRLQKRGIKHIYGGEHCTYSNNTLFYSYRRDGEKTGRMASLIWISSR